MRKFSNNNSSYLMESPSEGKRIRMKTNLEETQQHLITAGLQHGQFAIDVGCASGETTRIMSKIVGNDSEVIGFDKSLSRINESTIVDAQKGIKNISYKNGSIYDMSCFSNNTFDFVWSRFLFEYLKEPIQAIKELKRITKTGGTIALADLDGNCLFHYPMNTKFKNGLNNILEVIQTSGFDPFVGRKLFSFFISAGFKPKDIEVAILPYHQIFGTPTQEVFENWQRKISILEENFKRLAPNKYAENEWVFDEFLKHLKSPDTITYSNIFIVSAKKNS